MSENVLVVGACGQLGTELVEELRKIYGDSNVIASDIRKSSEEIFGTGPFEVLDVMDKNRLGEVMKKYRPAQVYHLAALLSATAEANPKLGWSLNMDGLFHVLDASIEYNVGKVYWPSSIAVFGPHTPAVMTPQSCIMDPNTIYGISKLAGERLCEYYHAKYGVDVRSIRYPGIISYKSPPGGGTTDYAIAIFHAALRGETYECFLGPETTLPMIYMPDAIRATIELMDAPAEQVVIRSSYNVAGVSFNPRELAAAIQKKLPAFRIAYQPDSRQQIADSWPKSLDDSRAAADWGWKARVKVDEMVEDMLANVDVGMSKAA